MMTPTILYQQMKKWVSFERGAKPALQGIYFNGEKAYATDSHKMAIVKNWPVQEAHYETPEGMTIKDDIVPLDYEWVLPNENTILWRHEIQFPVYECRPFMEAWKQAFDFCKRITRKTPNQACYLQKEGKRLWVYAANDRVKTKTLLLEGLKEGYDWAAPYRVDTLFDAVEFLKATEPNALQILITNAACPILGFETDDVLMVTTCMNMGHIRTEWDIQTLHQFMGAEKPATEAEVTADADEDDSDEDILD